MASSTKAILALVALSAGLARASPVAVPTLPVPPCADAEAATNVAIRPWSGESRAFAVELSLSATPSNCAMVAFGRDASPADASLSAAETELRIGWDCGEWFLEAPCATNRIAAAASASQADRRALSMRVAVGSDGRPRHFAVEENGIPVFTNLAPVAIPCANGWNMLRLSARGQGVRTESLSVKSAPFGMKIWID